MYLKNLLAGGGIFLLTCCNTTGRKEMTENHVLWDSITVNKSCYEASVNTLPGCSLQISFIYPVAVQDKAILKPVQQQFVLDYFGSKYADMTPQEAAEKYAEEYLRTVREEAAVFDDSTPAFEYYDVSDNRILYNRNRLLSVTVGRETYSGGAHGMHVCINRVIDLKTGLPLSEKDVFIDDSREDLAKVIVDNLAASNSVDNPSELENLGFFHVNEIAPNGNFYVDDTGITYTFNEYEIAAYAIGPVTVRLSYGEIRHLLRTEGPVAAIAF
ncbi:MAG: DUF3298 and DUF4163 domain-containing protein [Tannerella sp.]|nr:DUF3298 and DUF4163 domain-containing protein [Tannerella sp.]